MDSVVVCNFVPTLMNHFSVSQFETHFFRQFNKIHNFRMKKIYRTEFHEDVMNHM